MQLVVVLLQQGKSPNDASFKQVSQLFTITFLESVNCFKWESPPCVKLQLQYSGLLACSDAVYIST